MQTSNKGKDIIKRYEGLRKTAYRCPAGVWTIGYGHTKDVEFGQTCNEWQAEAFLDYDLRQVDAAISRLVSVPINQNQHDALASFTFNLGEGNLKRSTLLKKINAGAPIGEIQDEFRKWRKAGGKVLPGLVSRREEEAQLYAE